MGLIRSPSQGCGLYGMTRTATTSLLAAIITTAANDLLRPVHDRMPVILPRDTKSSGWTRALVTLGHLEAP